MLFESGYLTVARWKGTPIRVHWSTPLGMLVFGQLRFVPGFWVGYLLIVVLHEMGHAWLSRRMGLRAFSIDVHALGGQCRYGGQEVSAWQRSVVAWGGVLAQAILLVVALVAGQLLHPQPYAFVYELEYALITINVSLIALNLLPVPPLDGAEAWKIIDLWRRRRRGREIAGARSRIAVDARYPEADAVGTIDEAAVRETVRRALSQAAHESRNRHPKTPN